jgi:hypothetical protein
MLKSEGGFEFNAKIANAPVATRQNSHATWSMSISSTSTIAPEFY